MKDNKRESWSIITLQLFYCLIYRVYFFNYSCESLNLSFELAFKRANIKIYMVNKITKNINISSNPFIYM